VNCRSPLTDDLRRYLCHEGEPQDTRGWGRHGEASARKEGALILMPPAESLVSTGTYSKTAPARCTRLTALPKTRFQSPSHDHSARWSRPLPSITRSTTPLMKDTVTVVEGRSGAAVFSPPPRQTPGFRARFHMVSFPLCSMVTLV
jgi:hypothetical protein